MLIHGVLRKTVKAPPVRLSKSASRPENIGPERRIPAISVAGPVLSPSRITLENNEKIRLQPDRENAFARASGGADATAVEPSLARNILIYKDQTTINVFPQASAEKTTPSLHHQNRTVSWLMSMPRSCSKSSTLRSESGKRTYIMTARRMTSGDVLKYRKGERFVIRAS